jgi:hypothetical protein
VARRSRRPRGAGCDDAAPAAAGRCNRRSGRPGGAGAGEARGVACGLAGGVILPRYHGVYELLRRLRGAGGRRPDGGHDPEHGHGGAGRSPSGEQAPRVADWMGTGDAQESSRLSITKKARHEP